MAPFRKGRFKTSRYRRTAVRGKTLGKRKYRGRATLDRMTQLQRKVAKISRTIETKSGVDNITDNINLRHNNLVVVSSRDPDGKGVE